MMQYARADVSEAKTHLEAAFALWRQHVDEHSRSASAVREARRNARRHGREARRRWSKATEIASSPAFSAA